LANSGKYSTSLHQYNQTTSIPSYKSANKTHNNLTALKCWYTNATSLNNKFDEFKASLAYHSHPHLLFITETWFNDESLTKLSNYSLFKRDRQGKAGGGVALYVKNNLKAVEITCRPFSNQSCEQIWCELIGPSEKVIVGCIYRPPNSTKLINDAVNRSISTAKAHVDKGKYTCVMIVGDLNYPSIEWYDKAGKCNHKETENNKNNSDRQFVKTLDECYLSQCVTEPTFLGNFLDLVITDSPDRLSQIKVGAPLGSTACNHLHSIITWQLYLKDVINNNSICRNKLNYKKADFIVINEHLTNAFSTDTLDQLNDVNYNYNKLLEIHSNCVEKFVPISVIKTAESALEYTIRRDSEVKKALKHKHESFAKFRASPKTHSLKSEFRNASRQVKKVVSNVRYSFERNIVSNCKSNPKILYAYINSQKQCKDQIRMLTANNGDELVDESSICNRLNEAFHDVFTKGSRSNPMPTFTMRSINECDPNPDDFLSIQHIIPVLESLNITKSQGIDKMHPHFLYKCSKTLALPLSLIFKQSFNSGQLPQVWKEANITPIYKRGSRSDPLNYRPVSLTSVPAKVMERLVKEILLDHFNKNKLFTNNQHGFMRNRSCTTNLLESIDALTGALDAGLLAILVLLDFAKAFDIVPHEELIIKLKAYGVTGRLLAWLTAYLSDRKQRVVIGNAHSDWKNVDSGRKDRCWVHCYF
jgi:Reverse transcriptase (RNA-dependent DNA polymerase)/Endonuclease-reverse transcriptase